MRTSLCIKAAGWALAVTCLAGSANAQAPAGAAQGAPGTAGTFASSAVEKPTYVVIPMEIMVNRPVAEVWKRVGGYCVISEWIPISLPPCTITAGTDNEVGAVRSVGREIMVAKTQYSYTYTQPVVAGRPYNLYHGTLEARAMTPTTTKLLYTLILDNSMLPDDAAREKDKASRTGLFTKALENMKTLAEGGTVPPPPARGGGAPPASSGPGQGR
jgi:hypothetical protein